MAENCTSRGWLCNLKTKISEGVDTNPFPPLWIYVFNFLLCVETWGHAWYREGAGREGYERGVLSLVHSTHHLFKLHPICGSRIEAAWTTRPHIDLENNSGTLVLYRQDPSDFYTICMGIRGWVVDVVLKPSSDVLLLSQNFLQYYWSPHTIASFTKMCSASVVRCRILYLFIKLSGAKSAH